MGYVHRTESRIACDIPLPKKDIYCTGDLLLCINSLSALRELRARLTRAEQEWIEHEQDANRH